MTDSAVAPANHDAPIARRGILVVLPHPDDESFSSGGTISMHAAAGVPVRYLCGTYGDMGRNMGNPFFAHRESLRDVREKELMTACSILGCDLRWLGLRDKMVAFEDLDALAATIAGEIRELQPDVVITFYPGHGVHPDHDALGEATVRAGSTLDDAERPDTWLVAVGPRAEKEAELGVPDVRLDVSAFADKKRAALEAHRSQTEAMFARLAEKTEENESLRASMDEGMRLERFYLRTF